MSGSAEWRKKEFFFIFISVFHTTAVMERESLQVKRSGLSLGWDGEGKAVSAAGFGIPGHPLWLSSSD